MQSIIFRQDLALRERDLLSREDMLKMQEILFQEQEWLLHHMRRP